MSQNIPLISSIDALLPQTQCGKCGHNGCEPYARGIASGEAINKCPPGGSETISALASLLNLPELPVDPERGTAPAQVAYIREAECIGCTKCIQACPVDAILGAPKLMHTVLIDQCTGCDLCVAPCPVDCIELRPLLGNGFPETKSVVPIGGDIAKTDAERIIRNLKRDAARGRFERRAARMMHEQQLRDAERRTRQERQKTQSGQHIDPVDAAIARIRAQNLVATSLAKTPEPAAQAVTKKARIDVAMSRAQLNKALKAFGHPPTREQHHQLTILQHAYEAAEAQLTAGSVPYDMKGPA